MEKEKLLRTITLPKSISTAGIYQKRTNPGQFSIWFFFNDIEAIHIAGSPDFSLFEHTYFAEIPCTNIAVWESVKANIIKLCI